jgi:hypothetical protein
VEIAAHIDALELDGTLLADAAHTAGLTASVPTCPGWQVRDLVRHQAYVHHWAARHVIERPPAVLGEDDEDVILASRPDDAELVSAYRIGHAALVAALHPRRLAFERPRDLVAAGKPFSGPVAVCDSGQMPDSEDKVAERVWRAMPAGSREALTRDLPPTDLQTLLIAVARARAERVTPADVMRRWQQDRFVRPAASDPRRVAAVEARLWQLLPAEFAGIELSPVVPLGTCTAVAPVSENRIVATIRNTEVVSDSTNALAVEAATRRRGQAKDGHVDLAACHRQLRAQVFGPGAGSHFRLFTLTLIPHRQPRIELSVFDNLVLAERLTDTIRPSFSDRAALLADAPGRTRGRGYYNGFALRIAADGETELGDGGLTTYTAQLTQDAKERCLVSCLATERLTTLVNETSPA